MSYFSQLLDRPEPTPGPAGPSLDKTVWRNSTITPPLTPSSVPSSATNPSTQKWSGPKRPPCPYPYAVQELCGHGSWQWRPIPCNKWACPPCAKWRTQTELVPELTRALAWGLSLGVTPKFITLTYQADSLAAQPSKEGAKLRSRHIEFLTRWIRRNYGFFHYLSVSETTKQGAVHFHCVALCPRIPQKLISQRWLSITGDSWRVDIQNVYRKCRTPNCWKSHNDPKYPSRRAKVAPPGGPNTGKCQYCGDTSNWQDETEQKDVATEIANYCGKYLSKEGNAEGIKRKMNRSKLWSQNCVVKEEPSQTPCVDCETLHEFEPWAPVEQLIEDKYVGLEGATLTRTVAYHAKGKGPCKCWNSRVWRESTGTHYIFGHLDLLRSTGHQPDAKITITRALSRIERTRLMNQLVEPDKVCGVLVCAKCGTRNGFGGNCALGGNHALAVVLDA